MAAEKYYIQRPGYRDSEIYYDTEGNKKGIKELEEGAVVLCIPEGHNPPRIIQIGQKRYVWLTQCIVHKEEGEVKLIPLYKELEGKD